MDNIQSLVLTADKVTIADALIKNAMIDSINANKINTGTINTNNVNIQSADGSMIINGTTQQFKDKNNKVRIQIGKDAQGNFTFALFSQDGVGVLIDETGIKSGAVPNGLIVNDMVSDNANISGGKLDISSVISSINNNVNTLNSSKIKFDDTNQTLDIAFNQLKSKVDTIENITVDGNLSSVIEQVNTNTTNISVAQGQISSLISNTTITKQDGTVVQLKDEFNSVKDTVNSHTQTINSHESALGTVSAKQSELEQNLNGFKTTVSNTYTTKETTNSMQSQIQQNADSMSTKVNVNGVISSINQSSETVAINASKINLNGYVSNDEANWSIDTQGNMESKNMNIEGDLSADTITCNTLNSPKYPGTLDGDIELFVNSSSGNDDAELDDNVVYKTIQGAIDALPKFLNGKTAHITMQTNSTEDVYMKGFVGGAVRIYMNGKTLYGTFRTYVCSAAIHVYGGTKDSTEGATGIIHPNVGLAFATRSTSVGFESSQYGALYKVKVFAPDTNPSGITSTERVCVASQAGTGSVYCKNVQIVNAVVGFRCNNHGSMHVNSSSGIASKYGFQCVTGGMMSLANNSQAGGETGNINKSSGGQIWYDTSKVTFATGNQTTESDTAPTVSGTKTITIKSSYGDTYRSTVYNNWKKDGTVRQGDYGYGDCTGCWFFGAAFSELKGKTITKVQITIKRQTGGTNAPVEHKLWMHGHTGRPSGAPTLTSGWSQTFRLATGNSTTVAITNSTVLNAISTGTCKGFALRHTYDSVHYSVCSGSVTVKITYKE